MKMNRNESNESHKSYLQTLLQWTDSSPEVLFHRSRLESEGKPSPGIWIGSSVFQCPVELLQYAGQAPAHVALFSIAGVQVSAITR